MKALAVLLHGMGGMSFSRQGPDVSHQQNNSCGRYHLARFRRRTKVVSKRRTVVDLSLRLLHHLQDPANYAAHATKFVTIFG